MINKQSQMRQRLGLNYPTYGLNESQQFFLPLHANPGADAPGSDINSGTAAAIFSS